MMLLFGEFEAFQFLSSLSQPAIVTLMDQNLLFAIAGQELALVERMWLARLVTDVM